MDGGSIPTLIISGVILFLTGGGAAGMYSAHRSAKHQVSGDEREARRDTVADRDAFIATLTTDMRDMRGEVHALRLRVDEVDRISRRRSDHIDVLEAHIWAGLAPPPPRRPEGI